MQRANQDRALSIQFRNVPVTTAGVTWRAAAAGRHHRSIPNRNAASILPPGTSQRMHRTHHRHSGVSLHSNALHTPPKKTMSLKKHGASASLFQREFSFLAPEFGLRRHLGTELCQRRGKQKVQACTVSIFRLHFSCIVFRLRCGIYVKR